MTDQRERLPTGRPCRSSVNSAGRVLAVLAALMLGSCNFLLDEFTVLDKPGPVAEPQFVAPSGTSDRH